MTMDKNGTRKWDYDPNLGVPKSLAPDDKNYWGDWPLKSYSKDLLIRLVENYKGMVRRLEKSNQELGEELQRCRNNDNEPRGWD